MGRIDQLKTFTRAIKQEVIVYQMVLRDSRTPWYAKAILGLAIGYLLMPFDLIPDFIPILGQLDDILIVPGLVALALKLIPPDIIADCRAKVKAGESQLVPKTKLTQLQIGHLLRALSGSWFRAWWRWGDRYWLTKEQALKILKFKTRQDFGYDVKAWRKWFDDNPDFEF
jgi:uncharacterized membrane protein YkvA (DUF1232 family)